MTEWVWPDIGAIIDFQQEQIEEHGGLHGVKDRGALEAALARPANRAAYGEPDAAELAAAHAFGLAKAHAFNDGNKRIAWVAARLFLALNRVELKFEEDEAIGAMLRLAAGALSEDDMILWFRERIQAPTAVPAP